MDGDPGARPAQTPPPEPAAVHVDGAGEDALSRRHDRAPDLGRIRWPRLWPGQPAHDRAGGEGGLDHTRRPRRSAGAFVPRSPIRPAPGPILRRITRSIRLPVWAIRLFR